MLRTWAAMPSSTLVMNASRGSDAAFDAREPPGEELALGGRRVQCGRGPVRLACLGGASQLAQQVGPAGVQQMPAPALAVPPELVEDGQASRRPLDQLRGDSQGRRWHLLHACR